MPYPSCTIVIPVYNERDSITEVIDEVRGRYPSAELVVVDDGSSDGTTELLRQYTSAGVTLLRHPENRGYGAALKTGIRRASGDIIVTMDADGQHLASQIQPLLNRLDEDHDMVVGVRNGFGSSPVWRLPGKWLLTQLTRYLARRHIPDINSGLRAIRREAILPYLPVLSDGFSFSITSLLAMFHGGHLVAFVPIELRKRTGKSTVTLKTGVDSLILLLRIVSLFDPLRIFLPLSGAIALLGIGWGSVYVCLGRGISVGALLLVITALLLFFFGLLIDQVASLRKSLLEFTDVRDRRLSSL